MRLDRAMKLSLTCSIIVFLLLSSLLPSCVGAIHYDSGDGIWSDNFSDESTTTTVGGTSQCVWDNQTKTIHMVIPPGQVGRNYSFASSGTHFAYKNATAFSMHWRFLAHFFLSPPRLSRKPFNEQYGELGALNGKNETRKPYVTTPSEGIRKNVIHHFQFKLDGTADTIGNLNITWYGFADHATNIEMYFWQYHNITLFSKWELLKSTTKTNYQILYYNMSQQQLKTALDSDNYIDICIVAYGEKIDTMCNLSTDFISLQSWKHGLYKPGYAYLQTASALPTLPSGGYWEFLTWRDDTPSNTNITYQVLYDSGNNNWNLIPDTLLPDNSHGFFTPPVSLTPLVSYYNKIKLQANLSTKDPTVTPTLFGWTVLWQTGSKWQDLFHSEYRIGAQDNINWVNGSVNISLVSGDWPMFGQNPANTRASIGAAALTNNLNWWSDYHTTRNQAPVSIVLDGSNLYVCTKNRYYNNGTVYRYSTLLMPPGNDIYTGSIDDFHYLTLKQKEIVGSPAISGQYMIVATGNEQSKNYVYVYQKDDPSNQTPLWTFDYSVIDPHNPNICYWGSPIVANGKVYIASWSGDESLSGYDVNNELLALDLTTGNLTWKKNLPTSTSLSPSWSFSTPAYAEGIVVVGCMNDKNASLVAYNATSGTLLWNVSVGAMGKETAPVIYNHTVYVVSENASVPLLLPRHGILKRVKLMLSAVDLENGTILWHTLLGERKYSNYQHFFDQTYSLGQTTPVVANGILYVVTPDWNVTAFNLSTPDNVLWQTQIPGRPLLKTPSSILTSSPAYANGILYISIPGGVLRALDTTTKKFIWRNDTFAPGDKKPSFSTNPIVSNGLVFIGDEFGNLYAIGNYVKPSRPVSASIISKPIQLPESYWWRNFSASVNISQDSNMNRINFSLLDRNNNVLKTLESGETIALSNLTLARTVRLRADLWAKNATVNPQLISWNIAFIKDITAPFIDLSSLTPKLNLTNWVNKVIPQFTIKVKDNGTGLLVNSAKYILRYVAHNTTHVVTKNAYCNGSNGTTAVCVMTVNISMLSDFNNITAYRTINFSIDDLAGNPASLNISFKQDTQQPYSYITSSVKKQYNATSPFIYINATAKDNKTNASDSSGVRKVELYYRYSTTGNFSGDWIYFAGNFTRTPHWKFGFANNPTQRGGYFQLASIAYDNASNNESLPTSGDVSFLYDWTTPDPPEFSSETLWFNEQPRFSTTFMDDFQLATIQYRPNFDTTWTTIASNINKSSYYATWELSTTYWDQMNQGRQYYLYFRITDTVGNVRNIDSNTEAHSIGKDLGPNLNVTIEVPPGQNHVITTKNFTVTALVNDNNGSGVSEVALYYNYSKDNRTWTGWIHYDSNLTEAPFEWTFTSPNGDGYYQFQSNVIDHAGNEIQSDVVSSQVVRLSMNTVLLMYGLVIVLLLIGAVLYLRWRKKP